MSKGRNWEKLRTAQRMARRGMERVSDTGFTRELERQASRQVAQAEAFIQEAKRWEPIEEVAERNAAYEEGRRANKGSGVPLREILDACED